MSRKRSFSMRLKNLTSPFSILMMRMMRLTWAKLKAPFILILTDLKSGLSTWGHLRRKKKGSSLRSERSSTFSACLRTTLSLTLRPMFWQMRWTTFTSSRNLGSSTSRWAENRTSTKQGRIIQKQGSKGTSLSTWRTKRNGPKWD